MFQVYFSKHFFLFVSFLRYFIYLFLERRREGKRERNITKWLPLVHPTLGTWPTTQACALTGNWTGGPVVHSIQSTEPHQPGLFVSFFWFLSYHDVIYSKDTILLIIYLKIDIKKRNQKRGLICPNTRINELKIIPSAVHFAFDQ